MQIECGAPAKPYEIFLGSGIAQPKIFGKDTHLGVILRFQGRRGAHQNQDSKSKKTFHWSNSL
jgi:hypothetical protein